MNKKENQSIIIIKNENSIRSSYTPRYTSPKIVIDGNVSHRNRQYKFNENESGSDPNLKPFKISNRDFDLGQFVSSNSMTPRQTLGEIKNV